MSKNICSNNTAVQHRQHVCAASTGWYSRLESMCVHVEMCMMYVYVHYTLQRKAPVCNLQYKQQKLNSIRTICTQCQHNIKCNLLLPQLQLSNRFEYSAKAHKVRRHKLTCA
jgi:hypothetical protein